MIPPSHRKARGFTLVELMVVIVILGSLIAIVGTNIFKARADADIKMAETQMSAFKTAIDQYMLTHRKVPPSLDTLTEKDASGLSYLERIPDDPWGNPYVLKTRSGQEYSLVSYGKDGQEGTEDDIKWPPADEE